VLIRASIEVRLKQGYTDPEGDSTALTLRDLGYSVRGVRVYKCYEVDLDAKSSDEAKTASDEMCRRLLANPTKDDYRITLKTVE
jgi:phosphoribosylformylglycinamidine synthase PurS subunit